MTDLLTEPEPQSAHAIGSDAPQRPVRASLLMSDSAQLRIRALTETLNQVMGPSELHFDARESRSGALLSAGRLHVLLTGQDTPMTQHSLAPALESDLPGLIGEPWQDLIDAHSAALHISVGHGPEPEPRGELIGAPPRETRDLMCTVAHVAATFLATDEDPVAIYWESSAQILAPDRFLAMADMLFPLPLFLQPQPILPMPTGRGTPPVGFDLIGAEELIGVRLRMAPAPAPFEWLVERALAYVAHARALGAPIPPGDSFGLEAGECINVSEDLDGSHLLTLEQRDGLTLVQTGAPAQVAA